MATNGTLTRHDLDQMGCSTPGCTCGGDTVALTARCHPSEGTEVLYRDGVLIMLCNACKREFANVAVRETPSWSADTLLGE